MKVLSLVFLFVIMSGGYALAEEAESAQAECVPNFTEDGSFFSGKTMRSFREFPKANKDKAFDNILSTVALKGWQIVNTNKDAGVISVSQAGSSAKRTPSPMNIIIKNGDVGIKVEIIRKTNGGTITSTDAVIETYCDIYKSI